MSKLLRINEDTLTLLEQLAQEMGVSKPTILQLAVDQYMRKRILNSINEAYATLQQDPDQ